jgi:hypothetical protein
MIIKANAIAVRTLFVYRSTIMASSLSNQPIRQPGRGVGVFVHHHNHVLHRP